MPLNVLTDLEFEFYLKPSDIGELSHLLIDIRGQAILWDDNADEKVIAWLKGHRLDIASARHSYHDIRDLFDSISPEISDLGAQIIRDKDCYVECCSEDEEEQTPCGSLVYINELIVEPEYQNRQIGTEMLKRMSEVVDMNKTLVALKAVPIVTYKNEKRSPELKEKLQRFYTRLGFRKLGDRYMVKDARDCYAQQIRALAREGIASKAGSGSIQAGK